MEFDSLPPDYEQQALTIIMDEQDPLNRALMLGVAVQEGDQLLTDSLVSTYHQLSEVDDDLEETGISSREKKVSVGKCLVKNLCKAKNFEIAYKIADDVERLNDFSAVDAKADILGEGYTGSNGELLTMCHVDLFSTAEDQKAMISAQLKAEAFLVGLAQYGFDLRVEGTDQHTVMQGLFKIAPQRVQRYVKNIAIGYAEKGHTELASVFQKLTTNHLYRGQILSAMGKATEDPIVLSGLSAEAGVLMEQTKACRGDCAIEGCAPRDVREMALDLAALHARAGNESIAMHLLNEFEPDYYFPELRRDAHIALYEANGTMTYRAAALKLLGEGAAAQWEQIADPILRLVKADVANNQVVPSWDHPGETTPLLTWELREALGHLSQSEQRLRDGDPLLVGLLGSYSDFHEQHYARKRRFRRTVAFGTVALHLAENGAPNSARDLLEYVEEPINRVKVLTRLSRLASGA